jgi:hypothetical protein
MKISGLTFPRAMAAALVEAERDGIRRCRAFWRDVLGCRLPTRLAICYPKVAQRHSHDVRIGYPLAQ